MATDKAAIEIGGRSMLRISVDALAEADSVQVIGGSGTRDVSIEPHPDDTPGLGPLGGILTALRRSDRPASVIVSCDLPRLSPAGVGAVVSALGDSDLAVPVVAGRPQWTVGAWRTDAWPQVEASIGRGERSIRDLSRRLRVAYLLGDDGEYRDVDTPEDLDPLR